MEPAPALTKKQVILRVFLLALVLAGTVLLIVFRDKLQSLESLGYPGIFLLSLLSNATIIVPLPGVIITSAMAMVFNPFWVAIAAGLGAALGELSGYLAGVAGQVVLQDSENLRKLSGWITRHGEWAILFLALVPNPLFDMAGILAGSSSMPVAKFLFFCAVGKIIKMLLFAYLGAGLFSIFR